MFRNLSKRYGRLEGMNVLTQAEMQPQSDSRTKQKRMLGEKRVT